jgi:hypothetical protein
MAESEWVHYAMFFLGVLLVVGSVGVGIGALQYEFQHESETAEPDDWDRPLYQYEELSDDERRIVDRARSGERFVFEDGSSVPGEERSSLGSQQLMVYYPDEDTYYVFTHQIIFVPTEPVGVGAIAMLLAGVGLIGDSIRRHHFPQRDVLWRTG